MLQTQHNHRTLYIPENKDKFWDIRGQVPGLCELEFNLYSVGKQDAEFE